jgi:beta-amylase
MHTPSFVLAQLYRWLIPVIAALSAVLLAATPAWSEAGSLETAAVMAPLEIRNDAETQAFQSMLGEAKAIGVNAVSVDVWWGKVEKDSDQNFNWTYYDQVFDKIRQAGLKIAPILSFHKCGGGPGDDCNIPLPGWLWSSFTAEGLSANDLKYESETGKIQDDAVAPWASANAAVLDEFSELMQAFATHFAPLADSFAEINISLGPTGELRYPAYNKADGWNYPDRGNFQAYSRLAEKSFRDWALANFGGLNGVATRWGIQLADPDEIRVPGGGLPANSGRRAQTFVDDNDQVDTPYGRDFIDWYNQSLVDHGRRLLLAADEALAGPLAGIPLGMKLPGVHWQMMSCSPRPRIAEITAGLVRTSLNLSAPTDAYGYKPIMDMKPQIGRNLILHFTAAEMDNDPACGGGNSMAEALVFWISGAAQKRNITHKSENALACVNTPGDDRTWDLVRNAFTYASYQGFNLLRLSHAGCDPWGVDKAQYQGFIRDSPPPGAWYFRGTPNNWGTTAMEQVGEGNVFKTWQTFSGKPDPRFKICHYPAAILNANDNYCHYSTRQPLNLPV